MQACEASCTCPSLPGRRRRSRLARLPSRTTAAVAADRRAALTRTAWRPSSRIEVTSRADDERRHRREGLVGRTRLAAGAEARRARGVDSRRRRDGFAATRGGSCSRRPGSRVSGTLPPDPCPGGSRAPPGSVDVPDVDRHAERVGGGAEVRRGRRHAHAHLGRRRRARGRGGGSTTASLDVPQRGPHARIQASGYFAFSSRGLAAVAMAWSRAEGRRDAPRLHLDAFFETFVTSLTSRSSMFQRLPPDEATYFRPPRRVRSDAAPFFEAELRSFGMTERGRGFGESPERTKGRCSRASRRLDTHGAGVVSGPAKSPGDVRAGAHPRTRASRHLGGRL